MKRFLKGLPLVIVSLFFIVTLAHAQSILTPGTVLEGFALDKKNTNFPMIVKIVGVDEGSGNFTGEVSWPSLNSVHRIEGRINGHTITFNEVSHIKKGSAHLHCEYALIIDGRSVDGRWVEPGRDRGTVQLKIQ